MNANTTFKWFFVPILGFILLGLTTQAKAEIEISVSPHGTVVVNNTKSDLEAGIDLEFEFHPDKNPGEEEPKEKEKSNLLRLRVMGKTPFTSPEGEDPLVQFDHTTDSWRLATLLEYQWDMTGEAKEKEIVPTQYFSLGLNGELGFKEYAYFPNGGEKKENSTKPSFSAGLRSAYFYSSGKFHGALFMPQLILRYDRSWKAASKTGIVVPGETDEPSTVVDKIIEAPTVAPTTTARLAFSFFPGWNIPLAFGFSPVYGWSSKTDDWFGTDLQRMQLEFWTYFFPKDETANTRIGLAPFWNISVNDKSKTAESLYGLLFQLRVGDVMEY